MMRNVVRRELFLESVFLAAEVFAAFWQATDRRVLDPLEVPGQ